MRLPAAPLASLVLLALWLGAAILVATVVAPAAFAVLPSRTLAGALVGRVLPVLFWSGMLVGVAVAMLGRGQAGARASLVSGALLALASAVAELGIGPRIAALRSAVGGPMDALDPADPRRQAFGRLHGLSVACLGVGALAALALLVILLVLLGRGTAD